LSAALPRRCPSALEIKASRHREEHSANVYIIDDILEAIMLFIVRFTDKPNVADSRRQLLAAHKEWLDKNRSVILVPGALRADPETPVGGLWIVEAQSRTEIEELLKDDPFWVHGLRASVEILYWFKAFPERKVSV
jgi:uncharacterized protein YciI